jgi:hypothetical protein
MTFKVTVTYKPHDAAPVMQKEMTGVVKVERTWEEIGNSNVEVLRVYYHQYHWATWGIGGVLYINMIPELN